MKRKVLTQQFYERPVLEVAPELLGKYLLFADGRGGAAAAHMITEVEAYDGVDDKACHASRGRTKRTEVMFGPPGHWYLYLIYGMYDMLNIVTGETGYPAAVLIRGIAGYDGPGKLTKGLGIGREWNAQPANAGSGPQGAGLWIEDRGVVVAKEDIVTTPRIGVDYAGEWADKPWRFVYETTRI